MKQWAWLAACAALAGCSEVTYLYPTETTALDPKTTSENREKLVGTDGSDWQKRFADQYADRHDGPFLVSPSAAWQASLLFLNGSDDETYDSVLGSLGLRGDREFNTVPTTAWLTQLDRKKVSIAQGLFFVWPVVPSRAFQVEAARLLAADVVKIGNGRRGAAIAMGDWSARRTGHRDEVSLSADFVFESLVLVDVKVSPGGPCQEKGLRWEVAGGETFCAATTARAQPYLADVTRDLADLGMVAAKKGTQKMRPMAIELENKEIVGRFRQVVRCDKPALKPGQRFQVVDGSGQIIVAGRG